MASEQSNTSPEQREDRRGTNIQEIVKRHMQNKDDVITEEDIKYARIGHSDETPTVGAEAEAKLENDEEKDANDQPLTPWDVKE